MSDSSYQKLRREFDKAEAMMGKLRRDVLGLSLEIHRLEQAGNRIKHEARRAAYRAMGLREPKREQLRLRAIL